MRSKDTSGNSAKKLAHDIRNSIHHIFGNHKNCSDFCKAKCNITTETNDSNASSSTNTDEDNLFDDQCLFWTEGSSLLAQEQSRLHSDNLDYTNLDKQMLSDVSILLNRLASKSEQLIGNDTTNAAEAWMHIRSKFDGGKFVNLCNRGSWHARCYGAAARQNLGTKWATTVWKTTTETSPGHFFDQLYDRKDKDHSTTMKSIKNPEHQKRRWQKKMKGWSESTSKKARKEYGPDSTEVSDDLDNATLERLKIEYFNMHIEMADEQLDIIQKQTLQQSTSQVWKTERKKRLTASHFGKIVRRNPKLKVTPLVKELLYSTFKGNQFTVKGLQEERNTIHEYVLNKADKGHNVTVEPVGLVVNKHNKFLAASPDGMVKTANGDNGLIELKNLLQNKNISFIQATKAVKGFCLEERNGGLALKKTHLYYFQCQGLVNVTGLPWIDFVVRSTNPYQLHIERICSDTDLWNNVMLPKLTSFYHKVLLPELAGPRYNKVPGIREPGIWFYSVNNSSKRKKLCRTNKKKGGISAVNPIKETDSEHEEEITELIEKRKSRRVQKQKCVGRRISHKWIVNEQDQSEVWYNGSVLSLKNGIDGENGAEYEILYDEEQSSFFVDHLVEDFKDSCVTFLDL